MSAEGRPTIRVEHPASGVVLATLNRPERRNAMTVTMFAELADLARELDDQRSATHWPTWATCWPRGRSRTSR